MADQEQRQGKVEYLIKKLRVITLTVQIIPFIYTALYIIILVLYAFCPVNVLRALDTLFYVSPVVACMFLVESRILKLCRWHRISCILPVLPQIPVFIDYHIIRLTEIEGYLSIFIPMLLSILLLIAAYNVFLR